MKFRTLALATALFAPKVNSQTVTNGNFTFVGSYAFPTSLGEELGGGSIVGDTLKLIVNAERSDAYLASVPITRDPTTGRITGFDFNSTTEFYVEPNMDQLTQRPNFVGDKYVYSALSAYYPYTMSFANEAFTDISKIENIRSLNITDSATGDSFYGPYGVDFSPVITDPGTGIGKLMCTSLFSFWEVGLQPSSTSTWEITDATKLAAIDAEFAGGFSFIPSGSNQNNIFFADWSNNIVKMMKFGTDGRPVVPTETTDFITGISRPWGFFFDPQTYDFFVSTWDASGGDGIFQFKGFPPGLDTDVVIANIQNEMQVALAILLSGRRKLKLKGDQSKSRMLSSHRVREKEATEKKAKAGKTDGDVAKETEIPTSDEIANVVLNAASPVDATESFVSLLDETFTNDSFITGVLSGDAGGGTQVLDNIAKVNDSVDLIIQAAANSVNIDPADQATAIESLDKVKELLALLEGVVEGAGQ